MTLTISSKEPKGIPPKADFAIYVHFDKDSPNPQRVFQTVSGLIIAFQKLDRILCQTIDSSIEPVMMLEEVETGSLKVWLRNILSATDDQALGSLEWKKQVGKYLVKAKYLAVDFLNTKIEVENEKENRERVALFSKELASLARETDVKHLPDYKNPSVSDLAGSLREISEAKAPLLDKDVLQYITEDEAVNFDLTIQWTPETFEEFLTKEVIKYNAAPMILAVKKPDYLGNSQWDLRHGRSPIRAKINDADWLQQFQNREVDVRPGDSLRCMVEQEYHYGYDNELIAHIYAIITVVEVLENSYRQGDLIEALENESKNKK